MRHGDYRIGRGYVKRVLSQIYNPSRLDQLCPTSGTGHHRLSSGVSPTDGLPSAADAPLQRSELAKSAICGTGTPQTCRTHLVNNSRPHSRPWRNAKIGGPF